MLFFCFKTDLNKTQSTEWLYLAVFIYYFTDDGSTHSLATRETDFLSKLRCLAVRSIDVTGFFSNDDQHSQRMSKSEMPPVSGVINHGKDGVRRLSNFLSIQTVMLK